MTTKVLMKNGEFGEVDEAFKELKICSVFRDPGYDKDFRGVNDSGKTFYRGGKPYERPVGCMRYALKVKGVYGDDAWLGSSNSPNGSPGEWAVAYHGTSAKCVSSIISSELRPGLNKLWGSGVYCTPSLGQAREFASCFCHNGKRYKVVLQTRVDLTKIHDCREEGCGYDNWLALEGSYKSSTEIIRPYGICIFEC